MSGSLPFKQHISGTVRLTRRHYHDARFQDLTTSSSSSSGNYKLWNYTPKQASLTKLAQCHECYITARISYNEADWCWDLWVGKQVSFGDAADGTEKQQKCWERFLIRELGKRLWRSLFHVSFRLYVRCCIFLRTSLLPAKGYITSNYIMIKEEYIWKNFEESLCV